VARNDTDLADHVARGDRDALQVLMSEHGGAIRSVALRVVHNETLAEDVVQDTFVGFWNAPEKFDAGRGTLRSFLLTIAHRRAVDVVRSEVARSRRELTPPDPVLVDVEEEVWSRAVSDSVREALDRLPEAEREAISLAYLGGMTYVEVARRLEAPEGTVKSRIRSGMKKLAAALADIGDPVPD
jgi:RNA polymerase sigma-70 factor (ECF subfamily)